MSTRMPKTSSPVSSTTNFSEIGTPEPILEWWPVRYALKFIRKFVNYEIRKYVHTILYPVRVIIFLSGWPLVYFLRVMRYVFYGLYQACEYGYTHLSKKPVATNVYVPSPTSSISRPPPPASTSSYT